MINLKDINCFLLDMDGTVYLGNKLLPGALEFLQQAKQAGCDLLFLTNNSSRSTAYYAEKLTDSGVGRLRPRGHLDIGDGNSSLYTFFASEGKSVFSRHSRTS